MRTGYLPQGPIQYPTLGSLVAKELGSRGRAAAELRQHRAVPLLQPGRVRPRLPRPAVRPAGRRRRRQQFASGRASNRLRRGPQGAGPRPARPTSAQAHADARVELLERDGEGLRRQPPRRRAAEPPDRLRAGRAADADRRAAKAFDLDEEPAALRDAYGRNLFGQGCLLARRLVERGVPFVEVTLGGVNGGASAGTRTATTSTSVKRLCERARPRPGRR